MIHHCYILGVNLDRGAYKAHLDECEECRKHEAIYGPRSDSRGAREPAKAIKKQPVQMKLDWW